MTNARLEATLNAIDEVNRQDPHTTLIDGEQQPNELLYGHYMSECLAAYWSDSNELLQIAVRAQHIKRWHLKRSDYPDGKQGYLKWRKDLGKYHAELTHQIMLDNGYSEAEADATASILRKEKLKTNPDTQTLEDVACLVFLIHYFDDFAKKHDDEKIIRILQLTWRKMSEHAHGVALSLTLPDHLAALVGKALA